MILPTEAQKQSLISDGEQFAEEERLISLCYFPSESAAFDPNPLRYDSRIVPYIPEILATDRELCKDLRSVRSGLETYWRAAPLITRWARDPGILLGFAGYSSSGYSFQLEHDSIAQTLAYCRCHANNLPISQVIDDGGAFGVSGLSGLLAQECEYLTAGVTTAEGLRYVAHRDTLVIAGTEPERAAEVRGCIPDILIAYGGGPKVEVEVLTACQQGAQVIVTALDQYPESSLAYLSAAPGTIRTARQAGKLVVCEVAEVTDVLDSLDITNLRAARSRRMKWLRKLLAPPRPKVFLDYE